MKNNITVVHSPDSDDGAKLVALFVLFLLGPICFGLCGLFCFGVIYILLHACQYLSHLLIQNGLPEYAAVATSVLSTVAAGVAVFRFLAREARRTLHRWQNPRSSTKVDDRSIATI